MKPQTQDSPAIASSPALFPSLEFWRTGARSILAYRPSEATLRSRRNTDLKSTLGKPRDFVFSRLQPFLCLRSRFHEADPNTTPAAYSASRRNSAARIARQPSLR
ncbi:hypothetical protein PUNSTDRAFT_123211 [Punctularia strigosozonata HHB-11173 SS5]|uniref:Uncharacterized protein n=1 Tax=Punctularia strigosozonata (strain HHB-11173) TaxID=741275 RepID=R7S052_PUNST|nr:uncharacterized protein PUNSTDRAFT_123211 [Punctularia strigosozonata HHB-11173 SS5]EIN03618.1 hypothetical protein PUNSTDRAFT_123211 [Punctularia strigosozonata HHB-11173 SS5]